MATKPASPALQGTNSLATGLALYLLLNEGSGTNAADLSGNGHAGTLSGGASWTTDAAGNAVACTGGGNLQVPWPAAATGDSLSLLVIHKPTTWPGGFTTLFDDTGRNWSVFFDTSGNVSFNGSMFPISGSTGMAAGSLWQFLAVRDRSGGGSTTYYVNGTSAATGSSSTLAPSALTLHFGDNPSTGGSTYDGLYDLIALWTRVLTPTEIAALVADPYAVVRPAASGVFNPYYYQHLAGGGG